MRLWLSQWLAIEQLEKREGKVVKSFDISEKFIQSQCFLPESNDIFLLNLILKFY